MDIRLERPEDYAEVEKLTRDAFWNVFRPGCLEHYVLHRFRTDPDFIPELDFVMEEDGRIIGHVMFSKAVLVLDDGTEKPSWTFGPISIHPNFKRRGYGLKLLEYSLDKAREMGVGFLCMEGNIDFYKHAGFRPASEFGIHYHSEPRDAVVPYFLANELIPGWLGGIEATYTPPRGYFVADAEPDAFEEKGFAALWGDYFPDNPASGRVMEKCGFVDTGREVMCPNLIVGSDRPVHVMRLDRKEDGRHSA